LFTPPLVRADTIYATGNGSEVIKFSSDGSRSTLGSVGGDVVNGGLAIDNRGNIYAADHYYDPATIYKFTPGGTWSVFVSTGLDHPSGLAFDPSGNLYAANYDNTIEKFTPDGVGSVFATGLNGPLGLACDRAGNLYSANFGNATIYKFTPGGVRSVFAADPGDQSLLFGPYGLAFDATGNLYVANELKNTIVKFTPGGVASLFADSGMLNPCGLAFDSAGNLYAANQSNGTIEKFTPGGAGSLFASGFYNGPVYLAIQPVPESSAVRLLVFGSVGLIALRSAKLKPPGKRLRHGPH
jgi:DNA-binding beta-propeller fold protein YncE